VELGDCYCEGDERAEDDSSQGSREGRGCTWWYQSLKQEEEKFIMMGLVSSCWVYDACGISR
jgi:hypothetical protein